MNQYLTDAPGSNPSRRSHSKRLVSYALAVSALILSFVGKSSAQLLSYEPFLGYTVGAQVTATSPSPSVTGYSGNWSPVDFGNQRPTVLAGRLNYTNAAYAAGVGNSIGVPFDTSGGEITAANSGRMYRVLDSSLVTSGTTARTVYLSWLFQTGLETGGSTYQVMELYNGSTADAARAFSAGLIGGTVFNCQVASSSVNTSTGVNANTNVHLFVVKFVLSTNAASDSVTIWVDPALGAGDPAGGTTVSGKDIVFDRLAFSDYEGNSANWGEIRWGGSFNSVTITNVQIPPLVTASVDPTTVNAGQPFTVTAAVTPGSGTITNVSVNLSSIGLSGTANLVLSNANIYTNTFVVPGGATVGGAGFVVKAIDTMPLTANANISLTVLPAAGAAGQLLSYESFGGYSVGPQVTDIIPSPLVGGYTGNWTAVDFGNQRPTVASGSLSYGGAGYAPGVANKIGVPNNTSGGEINAGNSGRMFRLLDSSLLKNNSSSGVVYLSWLFQDGMETGDATYQALELYNGNTADANRTFFGGLNGGSIFNFAVNNAAPVGTGISGDGGVHLFVARFAFGTNAVSDSVTVWVDPTLGAGEPSGGITVGGQNLAFDRIAVSDYEGNSANWSDIRWGTTFNSVTITNPPASPSLVAVVNPIGASVNQTFTVTATVTPGSGSVTNVNVNLAPLGLSANASLVLSNANVYTNTFTVPSGAVIGTTNLTVMVIDSTPLSASANLSFSVLPNTRQWTGAASVDSKWSTVANWLGNVPPSSPLDSVTFAGTTRLTPDMNGSYSIAGLTYDATAGSFNIGSSTGGILTNGVSGIVNQSANPQVVNVPLVLSVPQTFDAAAGNITLSNTITGGVDLTKGGAGTVTFAGSGTSLLGNLAVTNGLAKVTAGSVTAAAVLGNSRVDAGATLEVAGGSLTIASGNTAWYPIGDTAATTSTLTISGGTMIITNNFGIQVGHNASGILNVNSGSLIVQDLNSLGLSFAENGGIEGTVNLNGGTLQVVRFRFNGGPALGTGYFYLNGGKLMPTSSRTDFVPAMGNVTTAVRNGGAIVDTAGFNVTIGDFLEHSPIGGDNDTDGGLTKLGAGTLTLSAGYAYTGPTKVLGGTLTMNTSLGVPGIGGDLVVSNATLTADASSATAMNVSNVVIQAGALLNLSANSGAAAITGSGGIAMSGPSTVNINYGAISGNPTVAVINVIGGFTATGTNTFNLSGTGSWAVGQFPLIAYTGTPVSTANVRLGTLPAGVNAVLTNNVANSTLDVLITFMGNSLSWHGADAGNTVLLTNWDVAVSANWYDATLTPSVYNQYAGNTIGDLVTFGDNGYNLDGTNVVNLAGRVVPATVTIDSGSEYRLTGTGGIDGSAGLVKNSGGTFIIGTSNNFTGGVAVNAGTLGVANNSALGASTNLVSLAGGTLQLTASVTNANPVALTAASFLETPAGVTAKLSGPVAGAADLTSSGAGNLTLAGNVAVSALTKSDNGTLNLAGTNSFNGNVTINAGTLNVEAGATTIPGGGNPNLFIGSSGATAKVKVSGTGRLTSPNGGKFVRLGTSGGVGILDNGPTGLMVFNSFGIGFGNNGANSAGAIYNSGTFTNNSGSYLGNADNAYGYFRNGGLAHWGDNVIIGANDNTSVNGAAAVVDITGGSVVKNGAGVFWINNVGANYSGNISAGGINITGGSLTFTSADYQWNINNGSTNYAAVNITGSGLLAMNGNAGFGLGRNNFPGNRETFTLAAGGTLLNAYIFTTAPDSLPVFTFNGGTYQASAGNSGGMIQSGVIAHIQKGGATIDSAGFACVIPAALLAPTGNGVTNIVLGGTTTGYVGAPVVQIIGDGAGASAIANFDPASGTITGITVTSPGSGYTTATVTLVGGSGTPGTGATPGTATATAQLGAVSSGGLTKIGAGSLSLNGVNTYTGPTVVQAGTLSGTGTLAGAVTNLATLQPGNGTSGTLTVNGNLTLKPGSTNVFAVNGSTLEQTAIAAGASVTYGGTLSITPSGTFTAGQQFVLFSGAGATNTGNFASLAGSPGSGLIFAFTNGVLSVVSNGPDLAQNRLTNSITGGGSTLSLSWSPGWKLQAQTNSLTTGLSGNWTTITDGSATSTNLPIIPGNPSVFYRLISQ